jgi:hypothetical protein
MNDKSSSRPQKPTPASIPPPNQSPIDEIADLLDNLPVNACVELTRRLLTAVPSLPSGAARSRAVLKIVILFVAEYGSTPEGTQCEGTTISLLKRGWRARQKDGAGSLPW